jgi:ABC-type multidrug transport system ATPase subunit
VGLLSESDTSIVISSHYLSDIERIASRIVLMNAGRIALDVELDTLHERFCLATFAEHQLRNIADFSEGDVGVRINFAMPGELPAYVGHRSRNGEIKVVLRCDARTATEKLARYGLDAQVIHPNLEELYVVLVGGTHEHI